MAIRVECQCGKSYNVGDDKAGRKFRCQACQAIVHVPDLAVEIVDEGDAFGEDFGGDATEHDTEGEYDENPYSAPRGSSKKKGGGRRQNVPELPLGLGWWLFAWQRSLNFEDRARRSEFWFFNLYNFIFLLLIVIVLSVMIGVAGEDSVVAIIAFGIYMILSFAVILPGISVSIRRLHDIGKSGWWYLLSFACGIGGIILLVWSFFDSEARANQWGPCPK